VARILTQRAVDAAKPPKAGRDTRADGIVPGQQFIVHSGGKKSYRLLTRIAGKLENLPIGDAALMTLAEARAKGKGMLAAIAAGQDPREDKLAATNTRAETVGAVASTFIERHAKPRNKLRTVAENKRLIDRNVLPSWGRRPISSIKRRDVVALLDSIVDRGSPVAANRVFTVGRTMFGWAVERGLIETSPFDHVKAPTGETSRDRTPSDSELALILRAADSLGYPFGPYFKLLAYTGQRREEVAGMRWSELDEGPTLWTLPRERAKNNTQHSVPITPAVRAILVGLPRFDDLGFLFTTTGATSISGFSKAKAALDAAITELNGGAPLTPWRVHDLRRSMASGMAKLGVQMPVVEKLLNHVSGSFAGVAGIYQRHEFRAEKRQAMEAWVQHLLALESGDAAPNVVPFELKAIAT
jgi:integrase